MIGVTSMLGVLVSMVWCGDGVVLVDGVDGLDGVTWSIA
jgi:hypothetical protein